jgi:SAM-dependent methyltransferase
MLYLYIILFIVLIIVLIYLSTLITFFITKVPFVKSSKKVKNKILEIAGIGKNDILYDLGCGVGDLLILADKKYQAKAFGFELSPMPYLVAKLKIILNKSKARVLCKNFFKADLSKADIVFCYLMPGVNNKLKDKLAKELKKGTRVISCAFSFPGWKISEKVTLTNNKNKKSFPIYLYRR